MDYEKIKNILEIFLPSSIDLYNIIVCELSRDGIEREFLVNEDIAQDKIAILVILKIESPKMIFTMYSTENCKDILKEFLREKVDWSQKNEFRVSRYIGTLYLNNQYLLSSSGSSLTFCSLLDKFTKRQERTLR